MKNRTHTLLLLLIFSPLMCFAQNEATEELLEQWQDTTRTEIQRLESLGAIFVLDIAEEPSLEVQNKIFDAVSVALELAKKHKREDLYLRFGVNDLAGKIFVKGVSEEEYCPQIVELLDLAYKINDTKELVYLIAILQFKGEGCHFEKNILEKLEKEIHKIHDILEADFAKNQKFSNTDNEKIADALSTYYYGASYTAKLNSDYPDAISKTLKAIEFGKKFNLENRNLYNSYETIGTIHMDIGNYKEAERYLKEALQLAKDADIPSGSGSISNELSKLYLKMNQPQKALEMAEKAIAIMAPETAIDEGCRICVNEAYTAEAGAYNVMGDYETALNKLLAIRDHYEDPSSGATPYGYAFYFAEKATSYYGLKDYKSAIEAASTSLLYNEQGKTLNEAKRANEIIYKSEKALGNYKASLSAYEQQVTLKDSMTVLRNAQEVTRLELENTFQKEQLKSELAFQEELSKQKNTKNLLIALGAGVLLIAIALFFRLKHTRRTNKIIEAEKQKAQASEKAKHQFLANMSHEIRTPMNAIKGMTDILIRRQPKANQKEYLDGIKQSSDSLLVIINDILDISKIEAGKIELDNESFSINELVHNVHTIMQFKAEEKGLELKKDIPLVPIYVKGDAIRLRQILINLIGNAIKFTEKGIVTTTVKSEQEDNKLQLHFTVSDTGMGIDKDRLEKIFKSFEQAYSDTSRKFGGTGLGLSISKKLVELHNGKLWVDSEKGKGSQFHFTISYDIAEEDTNIASVDSSKSNISEALRGTRILLVEDNQFNAVVAQEEMEDAIEDVHVDVAENGAIAVEKLKTGDYDVILMDVQMPKMNGYEATKTIRAMKNGKAHIPIIAMTANVLKEEVDKCYEVGMDDFIGKPFDTDELLDKIYNLKVKTHE